MGYTNEEKAVFEKAAGTYERLAQQCMESVMNESSEERIQALNALASQYLGMASRMRVWANEDVDAIPVA